MVWIVAISVAAVLIVPAAEKLWRAEQPVPVPERTWSYAPEDVPAKDAPLGWRIADDQERAWAANTVYIPDLGVLLPFKDAGQSDGWLELERGVTNSGVRFKDGGTFERGSTVIAAHVNDRNLNLGPFAELRSVTEGMLVIVTDENGVPHRYKATALDYYYKDNLPAEVWDTEGPPMMTLVTCGGKLGRSAEGRYGYLQNVVVRAAPLNPTPVPAVDTTEDPATVTGPVTEPTS